MLERLARLSIDIAVRAVSRPNCHFDDLRIEAKLNRIENTKTVARLRRGQTVDMDVAIVRRDTGLTTKKKTYIYLTVQDRTGQIEAKQWGVTVDEQNKCYEIKFARIRGTVDEYENQLYIKLSHSIEQIAEPDCVDAFVLTSPLPLDSLLARLEIHIGAVHDPALKALLTSVFIDEQKSRLPFIERPAAIGMHHAWRYGLLQHTLEVTDTVAAIVDVQRTWGYEHVSRDLAVAGALLHDIGKIEEIDGELFGAAFTLEGSLNGHIMLGAIRLAREIAQVKRRGTAFPKSLEQMLIHLIASHHGKGEWGSPKAPMTAEAILLHNADKLSADLFYVAEALEKSARLERIEITTRQRKLDSGFGGSGRLLFTGHVELERSGLGDSVGEVSPVPTQEIPISDVLLRKPILPIVRILAMLDDLGAIPADAKGITVRRLPLVGEIAAGLPMLNSDNLDGECLIDCGTVNLGLAEYYVLRVNGDSMINDYINEGDHILVRRQDHAEVGDIVVVMLEDGATVKRLAQIGNRFVLNPSNPEHSPIDLDGKSRISIQGRVMAIAR